MSQTMPRKPPELPLAVARNFIRDMHEFHAEKDAIKRDEIASRQIHVLRQFQGKHERPIKLHQVKEMFEEMKDREYPDCGPAFWENLQPTFSPQKNSEGRR